MLSQFYNYSKKKKKCIYLLKIILPIKFYPLKNGKATDLQDISLQIKDSSLLSIFSHSRAAACGFV